MALPREQKKKDPTEGTAYGQMHDKLVAFFKSKQINLSKCDAFEETLLKVMEIVEKPTGCVFGGIEKGGYNFCYLMLGISEGAGAELVVRFNKNLPEPVARDITAVAEEYGITQKLSDSCRVIALKASYIEFTLLPEIEKYFEAHPALVEHYQSFNTNDLPSLLEVYQDMQKKFPDITLQADESFKFLWPVLLVDMAGAPLMPDALPRFSLDLVGLVCAYLGWPLVSAEQQKQIETEARGGVEIIATELSVNMRSSYSSDLNIFFKGPATAEPHKAFARCINHFMPGSAEPVDFKMDEKKNSTQVRVLSVRNKVLTHPDFVYKMEEATRQYIEAVKAKKPKETQGQQQESKEQKSDDTITFSSAIWDFKKILKYVSENKEYQENKNAAEFQTALSKLIEHLEQGDCYDLKTMLTLQNALGKSMKKLFENFKDDFKQREGFFSQSFFDHQWTYYDIVDMLNKKLSAITNKIIEHLAQTGQLRFTAVP